MRKQLKHYRLNPYSNGILPDVEYQGNPGIYYLS